MSIYNAYVQTAHNNIRLYQVAAVSEEAAKREAGEYGHVKFVYRVYGCKR